MKIFTSTSDAKSFFKKGSAIAIGNYDGIHLGHQAILNALKKTAKKLHLKTGLLTFEPHPAKVLAPNAALQLINTREQKIEILRD
ncbi:MAG TPA: riboflavin biosynthesis protein RibF, partial [bacterium]|nr:riboflavin biosynthesis protein RibF [bacterium]